MKNFIQPLLVAGVLSWCAPTSEATSGKICQVQQGTGRAVTETINAAPSPSITRDIDLSFTPSSTRESKNRLKAIRTPGLLGWDGIEIYFGSNSATLDEGDMRDLEEYARHLEGKLDGMVLLIEWYADPRGTREANDYLSFQRAEAVKGYLAAIIKKPVSFSVTSHWKRESSEVKSKKSGSEKLEQYRKVRITPDEHVFAKWLRQTPADIYLVDASEDMRNDEVGTEVSKWNRFLTHGFPAHADVYTFRTRNEHSTCPQTLEEQVVRGRRPLYDSLAEVVKNPSNSGKTITVVSDGRDDASVATPEAIIADANKLNIKINILAIGLYDETADKEEAAMQKLAEATGGSFFIRRSECECD